MFQYTKRVLGLRHPIQTRSLELHKQLLLAIEIFLHNNGEYSFFPIYFNNLFWPIFQALFLLGTHLGDLLVSNFFVVMKSVFFITPINEVNAFIYPFIYKMKPFMFEKSLFSYLNCFALVCYEMQDFLGNCKCSLFKEKNVISNRFVYLKTFQGERYLLSVLKLH